MDQEIKPEWLRHHEERKKRAHVPDGRTILLLALLLGTVAFVIWRMSEGTSISLFPDYRNPMGKGEYDAWRICYEVPTGRDCLTQMQPSLNRCLEGVARLRRMYDGKDDRFWCE